MLGGNRIERLDAECEKLVQIGLAALRVELVDREKNRLGGAAQLVDNGAVERIEAALAVEEEHDRIRFRHRLAALRLHAALQVVRAFRFHAAGVDEQIFPPRPFGFGIIAVAGDSRYVVDDGFALADQTIEQSRFADVRPPDDRHYRQPPRRRGRFCLEPRRHLYTPISVSKCGFCVQSGSTRTNSSRKIRQPNSVSSSSRACLPISFSMAPRLPMRIPLCESRSV